MKKLVLTALSIFTLGWATLQANTPIDIEKSVIEWEGKKVTGAHNGTISLQSGEFKIEKGEIKGGEFIIDMNSIVCLDIQNPNGNAKFVGHLKNDDFFSVDKYPTSKIVISKVVKLQENDKDLTHNVYGQLTIKGITEEIMFPAKITSDKNGQLKATAEFTVDRTKYDIKYGSASFFPAIADKAISNDMYFKVNVVTK